MGCYMLLLPCFILVENTIAEIPAPTFRPGTLQVQPAMLPWKDDHTEW